MQQSPAAKKLAFGLACGLIAVPAMIAGGPEDLGPLEVVGKLDGRRDVSAVVRFDDGWIVASDEGAKLQELVPDGQPGRYRVGRSVSLMEDGAELDIEALALRGRYLYVLGSHSAVRKQVDDRRTRGANRERIATVKRDPHRRQLLRLNVADGVHDPLEFVNLELWPLIENDPIVGPFVSVPGKENGVDLEGLAVSGDRLFIGFRSPVLRGGYVPVMALSIEDPADYELLLLDLDGLGVRSLAAVTGGFLIVGGPERGQGFRLFFWSGEDRLPGKNAPMGTLKDLGQIPTPQGRPEGLTVIRESAVEYELLVVYDGTPNGSPRRLRVPK